MAPHAEISMVNIPSKARLAGTVRVAEPVGVVLELRICGRMSSSFLATSF